MQTNPGRWLAAAGLIVAAPLAAQQSVPFRGDIPVAPSGIDVPPLPDGPRDYATAEGQDIRLTVLVRGLNQPWSMVWLPGGDMLVTERVGRLRRIRGRRLDPEPVLGVPDVEAAGLAGLLDLALHPDFDANRYVYFTYHKPLPDGTAALALARGRWDGEALVDSEDLFVGQPGAGSISRIVFGPAGTLYMSTNGGDAQDPMHLGGKVLRLHDDGRVPDDNPFVGREGYRPELFTLGHRSTLGLAVHPGSGEIWQNENGPNGGDEINILVPGGNYGWPVVSLGRTYQGPRQSELFQKEGYIDPVVYWTPSIAVSGMTLYTGDELPKWTGDVFVGGLRTGEIPGTGHVERILFNEDMQELRRESLLVDLRQRIRDIRMGPDELLYALTGEDDGALLRIGPAN